MILSALTMILVVIGAALSAPGVPGDTLPAPEVARLFTSASADSTGDNDSGDDPFALNPFESEPHGEMNERQISMMVHYLVQALHDPTWVGHHNSPILYVEDAPESDSGEVEVGNEVEDNGFASNPLKRSRYYRRYPWKRQNSRHYEHDNQYLCQPSRDDVFRLLMALHDARQGNHGRTVDFCNRRRPASAVFTNIRFLGRRK